MPSLTKYLTSMNKVLFLLIFLCIQTVLAQQVTVLDVDTREPIVNVAIYNYDHSKTALTDFDGKADLSVFKAEERITFRHLS